MLENTSLSKSSRTAVSFSTSVSSVEYKMEQMGHVKKTEKQKTFQHKNNKTRLLCKVHKT